MLPRSVAAGVTVLALSRAGWAISATTLVTTLVGVLNVYARRGYLADTPIPVAALLVMLALTALAAFHTSRLTLVLYIVGGSAACYAYLSEMLGQHPAFLDQSDGPFLFNRIAMVLVVVGTASRRPLSAIAWGTAGFLAGVVVTIIASLQQGEPINFGAGPLLSYITYSAAFLGLWLIQRSQRGRVPDFLRLRQQARLQEAERALQQRTSALLHDTVLNDLALVVNGPDEIDERMAARMLGDVATLTRAELLMDVTPEGAVDPSDVSLRNRLTALISDYQWRGLTVDVTGDRGGVAHMAPEVVDAAVGALGACLENILRHSGVANAEVIVSSTDQEVTWTVTDAGVGFDPADVAADRLGVRGSIIQRIEAVGGRAKIWSTPGTGTSVLITVPLLAPISRSDGAIAPGRRDGD